MNKIILGGIVTIIAGVIIAATGWNFAETAEMPEKYVNKEEHMKVHEKIDEKIDKVQKTVDDIKDLIIQLHTKGD